MQIRVLHIFNLTGVLKLLSLPLCLLVSITSYSQTVSTNRFKRIDYEYDLVSGKVNKVSYQKDSADQFIHQYSYDSDNRITKVETSSDNVVWDVDAKYFYYAHGPLARTEIGNDKVQGIDYAYTLQGWIKGVNSNTLDKKRDMGQDGKDTSIYDLSNPQLHKHFAQDAFGYSLNYFKGDYKAIGTIRWNNASNRFESVTTGSGLMQQTHDLFNGNIKSMVTAITQIDTSSAGNVNPQIPKPFGSAYKYDQLNRIKKSVSFTNIDLIGNLWQSSGQTIANMYGNTFSYDANGNILTQNRSDETGQEFEALNYKYRTVAGKLRQNRLYHVNDNTSYTSLKTDDIDDQGHFAAGASSSSLIDSVGQFNNYSYDNIGNLVKDKAEQIANIEWTVYGKVKRILRTVGSGKDNLVFDYDPNGNRIAKHVYDNANNWKYTVYYVRDAQGNVMCTYEHKNIPPPGGIGSPSMSFVLQEQHIYGNSRLGMYIPNKQLINQSGFTIGFKSHVLGKKLFEMGNHLGNVLTVVSDRKMPIDNNSDGVIDEYQVDLLTSNDFSPFGVKLYKRGSSLGNYRYGMNGQESEPEIVGSAGSIYSAEYWMYDARLGRRWNRDPIIKPWESQYACFANSPIWFADPDGLTPENKTDPPVRKDGQNAFQEGHKGSPENPAALPEIEITPNDPPMTAATTGHGPANGQPTNNNTPSTGSSTGSSVKMPNIPNSVDNTIGSAGLASDLTQNVLIQNQKQLGLYMAGRFEMNYKGAEKVYKTTFNGNQAVSSAAVQEAKASYALTYGKNAATKITILKSAQVIGNVANYAGLAVSGYKMIVLNDHTPKTQMDLVYGGLAFVPGVGWIISGTYFVGSAIVGEENMNKAGYAIQDGWEAVHKQNQSLDATTHIVCFVKGTIIQTPRGEVSIENLKKGDNVLSYNFKGDSLVVDTIVNVLNRYSDHIYKLDIGNDVVEATSEHPFYVEGKGWVKTKDLVKGDKLKTDSDKVYEIHGITFNEVVIMVYNIEVQKNENYFVGKSKILVHNKKISKFKKQKKE